MAYLRNGGRSSNDNCTSRPAAKPVVTVPAGETTITESATTLFGVIGPKNELFYRGGAVVHLTQEEDRLMIRPVDAASATSLFEKHVEFKQIKRAGILVMSVATVISEATAKQYLKSEACRTQLPTLKGVVHCLLLVEIDGAVHQVNAGYDPVTKLYVSTSATMPKLTVTKAVECLTSLLTEFRFQSEGDRSRALASFLTPALKFGGFINGPVPVEVAEANASQSGKSYRQQLVAAVYRERMAVVTKKAQGVGGLEGTFQKHLFDGRSFIQFDNVRGRLDSQLVESFMTAKGSFPVRIAFHPDVAVDPTKQVLFISSNGFESTTDLANRSSIVRIVKRENYNFPLHDGLDLVESVYANHARYLAAVYAVIRHWHQAGKPRTAETRHDFREWSQVCDWILIHVFQRTGLMEGHGEARERVANPSLSFFRNLAVKLEAQAQLNQPLSATNIAEFCEEQDIEIPHLSQATQADPTARRIQIGKLMKAVLNGAGGREWEGYRVDRAEVQTVNSAGNSDQQTRYTVVRVGEDGGGVVGGQDVGACHMRASQGQDPVHHQ